MQQTLRHLIADGKTEQAINQLRGLNGLDKALTVQIDMLSARFNRNESTKRMNVTDPAILSRESNDIDTALLSVIQQLDEGVLLAQNPLINTNRVSGFVRTKNENKPLHLVTIEVVGTSDKTFTDQNGYYDIACTGKSVGDDVSLIVLKDGYVLLGTSRLPETTINRNPDKRFDLVLQETAIRESEIAKSEKNIIDNINTQTAIQNQFLLDKIQSLLAETQIPAASASAVAERTQQIQNLEAERAQLLQERDAALSQARDIAAKLLVFNPEGASEASKQAYALFLEGKLADAYAALDEALMKERAQAAQNLLQQVIADYMQKAQLAIANNKYAEAERLYTEGVRLDEYNIENLVILALFLQNQNETHKAISYYEKALALSKSDELIAIFCNNLGNAYKSLNRMPEAEEYYLQSLDIYDQLSKNNPQQFEPDLTRTAMNLGTYYYTVNKMLEAEKYYLQALNIYERLSKSNPQQFEPNLSLTLYNLGLFYRDQKNYSKAENCMVRALVIYEKWAKIAPSVFEGDRKDSWGDMKTLYEEMLAAASNAKDKAAIEDKLKALLARE